MRSPCETALPKARAARGLGPEVITEALFGAVSQSFRQVRAQELSYHGHRSAGFSGMRSFVTDFAVGEPPEGSMFWLAGRRGFHDG